MTVFWPTSLPQRPMPGMRASPQPNKISFQPETGPSIDRRRGSSKVENVSASFDLTSFDQVTEFRRWFETDLLGGTQQFVWIDPREDLQYSWKFASSDPYEINTERGTYSTLSVKLQRLSRWNG